MSEAISSPSDKRTPTALPAEVIISSTRVLSLTWFPCSDIIFDMALAIDTDPPIA